MKLFYSKANTSGTVRVWICQGRRQVFNFGEAKNFFRGRGFLEQVFDLILKISERLFKIFFYYIYILYIKHPISLLFVIILRINNKSSLCEFGRKKCQFLSNWHFNAF